MELNLETFALPPLIDDVVKTIEPLAAKNGNHVVVHCDDTIGTVYADQMRLRQALLNLMSNANKFTEKGTVTLSAYQGQESGRNALSMGGSGTRSISRASSGGVQLPAFQYDIHAPYAWPRSSSIDAGSLMFRAISELRSRSA